MSPSTHIHLLQLLIFLCQLLLELVNLSCQLLLRRSDLLSKIFLSLILVADCPLKLFLLLSHVLDLLQQLRLLISHLTDSGLYLHRARVLLTIRLLLLFLDALLSFLLFLQLVELVQDVLGLFRCLFALIFVIVKFINN